MRRSWAWLVGMFGLGALLAQAGHLVIYQLEFSAAAQAAQSQGAHAYFPAFAKTSLGLLGACLLGGLLVIGLARLLRGRAVITTSRGPSYIALLSVLFTIQIACFVIQETIESLVAGLPAASPLVLLMLGTVGQLPVAALAAVAIRWLAVRVEAALVAVGHVTPVVLGVDAQTPIVVGRPNRAQIPALSATCPMAYIKRGPPSFRRV